MVKQDAIYARFSKFSNGSAENVEDQVAWGTDHFGRPVKVYADDGLSASKDDVVRPGFEQLKADIAAGKIGTVWASEATRLERRLIPWLSLLTEWDGHGVTIHTKRDGIMKADDVGSELRGVLSNDESRRLKRRVSEGIERRAKAGRPGPAPATFGYERGIDPEGHKTLVIVPAQAEYIRWCAREILAGRASSSCGAELAEQGVTGAQGGKVDAGTIKSWLTNPTVAGYRAHKGVLYEGTWEPILSRETWESVKAALAARARSGTRLGKRKYLLSGLIECAECGAKMRGQLKAAGRPGAEKLPYYQCPGRGCGIGISGQPVEDHVSDRLLTELDKLAGLRNELVLDPDADRRRTEIVGELARFGDRRADIGIKLADEIYSPELATAAEHRLNEREAELQRELAGLPSGDDVIDPDEIRKDWPWLTTEEQRSILADLVDKVTISKAQPGYRRFDLGRVEIHGPGWDN